MPRAICERPSGRTVSIYPKTPESPRRRSAGLTRPMTLLAVAGSCIAGGLPMATEAAAATIPYSQGVLQIGGNHHVTVGPGGDFASCTDAIRSLPKGGPGGIVEFLPGDHVDRCFASGDRGNILITGRLGPNGERPRINTPTVVNPNNGRVSKEDFLVFAPRADNVMAVQNLEIEGARSALIFKNFGGAIVRNVFINGTTGGNGVVATETYGEHAGDWESWVDIEDSEVAHAGSGNTRHNIYLTRLDRVYIDGLYSHSANNSHALKLVARDVTVRNSVLMTSDKAFADVTPDDLYLSTTLLDMAACANSVIENKQFVGFNILANERNVGGGAASTQVMIDLKRRRLITGCDDPPYDSAEFNDPQFWADAAAGGYSQSNPYLLQHMIRNNTFINTGTREIGVVWNNGTGSWDPGKQYTFRPLAAPNLPVPNGWFEHAVAWLDNNNAYGNLDWGRETTNATHPASTGNPIFVGGVRVGEAPRPTDPVPDGLRGAATAVPEVGSLVLLAIASAMPLLAGFVPARRQRCRTVPQLGN